MGSRVEDVTTTAASSREFRSDINGLRAWAVIAVVCYHFGVPGFGGGFVGVDVFFVISGFLMTDIVARAMDTGRLSLAGFYAARARRIIPAQLVLCAVLLALGWVVLMPPDYKALASHAVYALSFLSNVEFWQEAGYFDASAHEKWLLHTWSLSVEWQFYMLWPVLLSTCWRLRPGRDGLRWAVSAVLLASLAASVLVTPDQPSAAFFLLHTRAWEMAAGAVVLLWARPQLLSPARRLGLSVAGLVMIALAIALFDKNTVWPGWRALLPVLGAMAVLAAHGDLRATSNATFQWIGTRSYSIYLWHWPLAVGLEYLSLRESHWAVVAGLAASVLAGHLSYAWVERQSQALLHRRGLRFTTVGLGLGAGLVALPAVAVWKQQGVSGRFSAEVDAVAAQALRVHPDTARCAPDGDPRSPSCVIGGEGPRVIAVGDSHVGSVIDAISQAHRSAQAGVVWWGYSGCLYGHGLKVSPSGYLAKRGSGYRCPEFIAWTEQALAQTDPRIPVVIINRHAGAALGNRSGSTSPPTPAFHVSRASPVTTPAVLAELAAAVTEQACRIARERPVYVLRPIPEMSFNVPKRLARRLSFGLRDDLSVPIAEYQQRNGWVWAAQDAAHERCGVRILDPTRLLCVDGRCYASRNGQALYQDDNHLSEHGSRLLLPMFQQIELPAVPGGAGAGG